MEKVLYTEMLPHEFQEAVKKMPVAYLPLGTLEWHGPHLPLGADGIQSQGLFIKIAQKIGGVVCPMLFLGPDSACEENGREFYGMDCGNFDQSHPYPMQQLPGSAYWIPQGVYLTLLESVVKQLHRAGFKILVAHGHGPSVNLFRQFKDYLEERYQMICLDCWEWDGEADLGFQVDHAAANETSITWGLRPDLVDMTRLPKEGWPLGIAGKDPRIDASEEMGKKILDAQTDHMTTLILDKLKQITE